MRAGSACEIQGSSSPWLVLFIAASGAQIRPLEAQQLTGE